MSLQVEILGIDAGGTMTDTLFVDAQGRFTVGKARSVPEDESLAIIRSADNALSYWSLDKATALPMLKASIYSGTAMINRLVSRTGRPTGLVITAGLEDTLRMERAVQVWLGKSYIDRLHSVTHEHNVPLIPRAWIRGVRERVDPLGEVAIPLYEAEAAQAIGELLDAGVQALCVCLLFSYLNPVHEQRLKAIALEVMRERGVSVPLFLSCEVHPFRGELPRLNTLIAEAYAAEPSRQQVIRVEERMQASGARADLRIMASHGGTIDIQTTQLSRSLVSGPIGGMVGARFLGAKLGIDDIIATDLGGTTFEVGVITRGQIGISLRPVLDHFYFNLPMVDLTSVGVGTGAFLSFDEYSRRVRIGPESAGDRVGMCYPDGGCTRPTITDCALITGLLSPDNFLGGEMRLDVERARAALDTQIAAKFGRDVHEIAAGILDMQEAKMRDELRAVVLGKGYAFSDYVLLSYGGGGPLHVGNYSAGLGFRDVLIPAWAAAFSAFGCTCAPHEYRFDQSTLLSIPPGAGADAKMAVGAALNATLDALSQRVLKEFELKRYPRETIRLSSIVRMQYKGQVSDLEIVMPVARIATAADIDALVASFERHYAEIYTLSAQFPEAGFFIAGAAAVGSVATTAPALPRQALGAHAPAPRARKGSREVYWNGAWTRAEVLEMEALEAGNRVAGLAIIEDPATTLVVPPGKHVILDEYRIFHLRDD
ncbi:MAG: hydantoinase/oxoprolinase family protein [Gammaproteobacteria bacterium]|nr:hydantoinase/oxoprolinase family protein [Gammaproteobacteria bacterium]